MALLTGTPYSEQADAFNRLKDYMMEQGYTPPEDFKTDGRKWTRYPTNGDSRDTAGFYKVNTHPFFSAVFGDFRLSGHETLYWSAKKQTEMSDEERAEWKRFREEQKAEAERQRLKAEAKARSYIQFIMNNSATATTHGYADLKQVGIYGDLRIYQDDKLVIPMYDEQDRLKDLQRIVPTEEGGYTKKFIYGASSKDLHFVIPPQNPGDFRDIYYFEGYATGASAYEALGKAAMVVITFNAANIPAVVKRFVKRYPKCRHVIGGDDDIFSTNSKGEPVNAGRSAAMRTAWKYPRVKVRFPEFSENSPEEKLTDFNDMTVLDGIAVVRKALTAPRTAQEEMVAHITRNPNAIFSHLYIDRLADVFAKDELTYTQLVTRIRESAKFDINKVLTFVKRRCKEKKAEAKDAKLESGYYDRIIEKMNRKHAVVTVNGKIRIMNEVFDPIFEEPDINFSKVPDLRVKYMNQEVPHPTKNEPISIAALWLKSTERKEYEGIVFNPGRDTPGYYNLYRGFAVDPRPGDWSLLKQHIWEVVACENEQWYAWILAWMARIVQDPGGKKPGTSIVLQGRQGTGKGKFVNSFGSIFGRHYLQIAQASQVTGRFNSHLKDRIVVFVDEGFWGGDKQAEGVIKNMVTEDAINIEPKGEDIIRVKNHVNLLIASNNEWVVPAGLEERRFFVINVSDHRIKDFDYFEAIDEQMDNGGREAMLYDLLRWQAPEDVNLRSIPRTSALFDQILHSMNTFQQFWFEILNEGRLNHEDIQWTGMIPTAKMYQNYLDFVAIKQDHYPLIPSQFGRELKKICTATKRVQQRVGHDREWVRTFPHLSECRAEFEELVNMEIPWETEAEF